MKILFACILTCAIGIPIRAADTVRICTYNILKFSRDNEDGRIPQFKMIMDSIRPDVLVCQEVADNTAGPRFVSEVLTWAPFASTPYSDGPDTDNMVVYNQDKFDLVGTRRIPTELRDIFETTLALRSANPTSNDTLVVYSLHLKAQDNTADMQQRAREMNALVSSITSKRFAIVSGDFNVYSPSEPALQVLLGPTAKRSFVDPLGTSWRRNDAAYASFYSQCTRATNISGCGGGVDGGVDDRFDFILPSSELAPRVIKSTYTHVGNDGVPRLNSGIDVPVNKKYGAEMVAALKCGSDHMPVFVDLVLGDVPASVDDVDSFGSVMSHEGAITVPPSTRATYVYAIDGTLVGTVAENTNATRIDGLLQGVYAVRNGTTTTLISVVR
jgi:endonuclease/exonuclease/phosphatase family metal-dependent hydrolase